jgi:16S rRNA (uracil1498-N3)-methyltransferase
MPRFLLEEEPDERGLVRVVGDDAGHLAGPLRARVGEKIALCLPGRWLTGVVERLTRDEAVLRVVSEEPAPPEPTGPTLYVALPSREAWEWILEKATELGAGRLQPVLTERSAPYRSERADDRLVRWQRIVEGARKQSGRTRVPTVHAPVPFATALDEGAAHLLLLDGAGSGEPRLPGPEDWADWAVVVGPEGGFTEAERELARARGAEAWSLGAYTLRSETAAVAALAAILCPVHRTDR